VQVSSLDVPLYVVMMIASLGWFDGGDKKFDIPIEKVELVVPEKRLDIVIRLVL
jgi:hypothetical protein